MEDVGRYDIDSHSHRHRESGSSSADGGSRQQNMSPTTSDTWEGRTNSTWDTAPSEMRGRVLQDSQFRTVEHHNHCYNGHGARRRKRSSLRSFGGVLAFVLTFLTLHLTDCEHDENIDSLRLELADLFQTRKLLNGEATYPARYKSFSAPEVEECSGEACFECTGEQLENLQAVKYHLEQEILSLERLGCPCDILSLEPSIGSFRGGTAVRLTITGLDLSMAFAAGPVDCWIRRDLENYAVVPAVQAGPNIVECVTPAMPGPFMSQITVHAPTWAVVSSSTDSDQFFFFDVEDTALLGVFPAGVPSTGGATLTLTGAQFPTAIDLSCHFQGVMFPATVLNSSLATCMTPALPEAAGMLQVSANGKDLLEPGVPLAVFRHPRITAITPPEGLGGELLYLHAAGLGMLYEPRAEDLLCRFMQQDGNVTVPAARVGNSSTVTCTVPNNTRGVHFISGFVAVELSLVGAVDLLFSNHGAGGANAFLYRCVDRQTRYATLVDFFPQCTRGMCCPAGYLTNGTHCNKCPEATYSFAGAAACEPCPNGAWSPAASPSPQSCVCNDGWVGSVDGLLEGPGDTCRTCGADSVGFTDIARREEVFVTRTVHTLGVYGVSAGCRACPLYAHAPAGSNHPADCTCGDGYMCVAEGVPCFQRLLNSVIDWSQRQCTAPFTPSAPFFEVARCSGGGGGSGGASMPCDNCTAGAVTCGCNCSVAGYQPNSTAGVCQDVDECALGLSNCPTPTLGTICVNEYGGIPGYRCECPTGLRADAFGVCRDVDECGQNTHGCHENADCVNTEGSFTCACKRGFHGDGIVDCWDGSFQCVGAVEVAVATASGNQCWAVPNNSTVGPMGDFYCDQDAGTTSDVAIRLFWLESQQWSEEMRLSGSRGWNFTAGAAVGPQTVTGFSWTETPAMIQYRVEGSDAWHPDALSVRLFNGAWEYRTLGDLCWVDTDGCNGAGCYAQDAVGCGAVRASHVVDFDECVLEAHLCDPNAACTNTVAGYHCTCNAGYFGVGSGGLLGPGTDCTPCPAGTFSGPGATGCEECPDAEFATSVEGSPRSGCECRPGYYGNLSADGSTCLMCEPDNYCPGGLVMVPCPSDSSSPRATGDISDCVCNEGYTGPNGGPCRVCVPGTTCEGGWATPEPCSAGNYSTAGQTECVVCPARSDSATGDPRCSCEAGAYDADYFAGPVSSGTCYDAGCSPVPSAAECWAAASLFALTINFTTPAGGVAGCSYDASSSTVVFVAGGSPADTQCSPGRPCLCAMCSPAACQDCGAGEYSEEGAFQCEACPDNADSVAGSAFQDCACNSGFYGDLQAPGDTCSACPPLATSEPGARTFEGCHCLPGNAGNTSTPFTGEDCNGTTLSGATCQFPFTFNGLNFTSCTTAVGPTWTVDGGVNGTVVFDDMMAPWCAITINVPAAGGEVETMAPFFGNRTDWWDFCACSHCTTCQPGTFSTGKQARCLDCPAGTYSDTVGAPSCIPCATNATSPAGSDSVSDCYCVPGFEDQGGACVNVDECSTTHNCDVSASCTDSEGSFTCECDAGFVGDGTSCATCPAGFACAGGETADMCPNTSYAVAGSVVCSPCPDNSDSMAGSGSISSCTCNAGWAGPLSLVGDECQDADECVYARNESFAWGNNCHVPGGACSNTNGSFTCSCALGWYGDGRNCTSLCGDGYKTADEGCDDGGLAAGDGCDAECNAEAGYACTQTLQNSTCNDVNECALGTHDCNAVANCSNTAGSFMCDCNAGFFGTGVVCFACTYGSGSELGATAVENCSCSTGFRVVPNASVVVLFPDGTNNTNLTSHQCENMLECGEGTHNCDPYASCSDTEGSFACQCPSIGFVDESNGTTGVMCRDIDECSILPPTTSTTSTTAPPTTLSSSTPPPTTSSSSTPSATTSSSTTAPVTTPSSSAARNSSSSTAAASTTAATTTAAPSTTAGSNMTAGASTSSVPTATSAGSTSASQTTSTSMVMPPSTTITTTQPAVNASSARMPSTSSTTPAPTTSSTTAAAVATTAARAIVYGANCDEAAQCINAPGSFLCSCNAGFADESQGLAVERGTDGACRACPADFFSPHNSSQCVACPADSSAPNASESFANCSCNPGYAGLAAVLGNCTMCTSGSYSPGGVAACLPCSPNSFSPNASTDVAVCVCDAGYYLDGAQCVDCPIFATSLINSTGEDCFCKPGWYHEGAPDTLLNCTMCPPCPVGQRRFNCSETKRGMCDNFDECLDGVDSCDGDNGACVDTDGSFSCFCNAGYHGNGSTCSKCTDNAHSDFGSTIAGNCSCNVGFDTGDGETRRIVDAAEECLASLEIQIVVATVNASRSDATAANGTLSPGCWSASSSEYCDANAGTEDDVWVRVQWADGLFSEWYALYSSTSFAFHGIRDLSAGFSFAAGATVVSLLTQLPYVGGAPVLVEYSVAGEDSFRPASVQARFPVGVPHINISDKPYRTVGELCWVDGDGGGSEQQRLGCSEVGRSATATLVSPEAGGASNATESETGPGTLSVGGLNRDSMSRDLRSDSEEGGAAIARKREAR